LCDYIKNAIKLSSLLAKSPKLKAKSFFLNCLLLEEPYIAIKLSQSTSINYIKFKAYNRAVILNECEESNLKSRNKLLALQPFKLDSSHLLRMTAMA